MSRFAAGFLDSEAKGSIARGKVSLFILALACALLSTPLSAQVLSYDDGSRNNGVTSNATPSLWLVRYATPAPGTTQVSGLSAAFGVVGNPAYPDGQALTFGIWSDPNGDGNPSDGVRLSSGTGVTANVATGAFVTFNFPSPVTVATSNFFVGYYMPSAPNSYVTTDSSTSPLNTTWALLNPTSTTTLASNNPASTFDLATLFTGVGMIRANLGPPPFNCALLNPTVVGQWGLTGGRCGDFVSNATSVRYESTLFGGQPPPVQRGNVGVYAYEVQFVNNRPQQPTAAASIFVAGSPIPLHGAAQWWDRAIAFNVSATGKYSIFRYNGLAKPVPLQAWVTPVIPLNLAPASNRLRVEVIGPNLVFSINGNVVRTLPNLYGVDQFGMGFVRTISTTGNLATDDWMEILDATTGAPPPEIDGTRSVSPSQQRANDEANDASRLGGNVDPLFAPAERGLGR
jgi:hypothetical protein